LVGIMALSFFGKGVGALGWAVMADAACCRSSLHGYRTEEGAPRRLRTGHPDDRTIPRDRQE
jgi:hypothetical protein